MGVDTVDSSTAALVNAMSVSVVSVVGETINVVTSTVMGLYVVEVPSLVIGFIVTMAVDTEVVGLVTSASGKAKALEFQQSIN